jgi:NADPH:quinone reductase-like Zn-dependent oxidoreductase
MTGKMSGVVLTGHGGPEMLQWRDDLDIPAPGPGDVLVRVRAAGVNNTDVNTRIGWYSKGDNNAEDAGWTGEPLQLPRIQGADVCGEIAEVGADIAPDRIGERVLIEPCLREVHGSLKSPAWYMGSEVDGGFAQYVCVAARHAHKVDCNLTDVELASFPCSYSTAENMLTRSAVAPGDTVLVTGASGGVGSATVQLARARGAKVFALTSPAKAGALRALGAAKTIGRDDNLTATLGANSVDVVIDLVAGPTFPTLLDVLRPGGRYAVAGAIAGPIVELDVRTLYLKDLRFFGCTVLEPEVFSALVGRIERAEIKPLVAETYALRDINAAQESFGKKGHIGKIVLKVP